MVCDKCDGTGSVPDHRYVSIPFLLLNEEGQNIIPTKRCECIGDASFILKDLKSHIEKKMEVKLVKEQYEDCAELLKIKKMISSVL